jgi:hypothetical protein
LTDGSDCRSPFVITGINEEERRWSTNAFRKRSNKHPGFQVALAGDAVSHSKSKTADSGLDHRQMISEGSVANPD